MIQVVYPIIIGCLLAFAETDLYENRIWALGFTGIAALLELTQIFANWKFYFTSLANMFDFVGIVSFAMFLLW